MGFNKALIISLLIVGLSFAVLSGLLLGVAGNYDVQVDAAYQETFDTYSSANTLVSDIDSTVEGGEVNPDGLGEAVYTNVVVAGKQSRQSAALAQDLVNQVPTIINVDSLVLAAIISLLFTFAAFGFIGMIVRKNP